MKKIAILMALLFLTSAFAKVNFPYPQEKSYSYGTYQKNISNKVKAKFQSFYSGYYEESGDYARIKFDDGTYTVSEGIGYGMIMMVYFSDNDRSYQSEFDKLWNYYQHWSNNNGLMNWKINGFSSVVGQNAATDAEFDVAFSLIMAYYQFGDEKYKTAAQGLLAKIRANELESDGLHKPGDTWNSSRNPGYVSPAAFELFKVFDNPNVWAAAITRNYTLLKANQNSTTGLPSGWSDDNGNPVTGTASSIQYDWDAPRAPWRWAWSYAWYGHSDALSLLSKLGSWLNNKSANDLKIPMNLDGSNGQYNNSTAVGPFACAMMHSSNYATKRESFASALLNINESSYFSSAMQILTGLLLSGNMQNFAAMTPGNNSSSSSAVVNPTSSASDGTTSVIDDFEDGNNIANTGLEDYWYVFTDSENDGESTVTNKREDGEYVVVSSEFAKNSDYGVGMKGIVLNKGGNANQPYVTLGLNVEGGLKGCKTFSYDYKGATHNFKVVMKGDEEGEMTGYAYHQSREIASSSWTSTTISVATGLNQPSWVDEENEVSLNISEVIKIQWEVQGANKTGNQEPTPNYLYVDNFACDGMSITPVVIPDDESSSSTKPKSSSSSHVNPTCEDGETIDVGSTHMLCVDGEWTTVPASSASSSDFALIDDFEDGDNVAYTGTKDYWYAFTDAGNTPPGLSTISNTKSDGEYVVVFAAAAADSKYGAGLTGISLKDGPKFGEYDKPSVTLALDVKAGLVGCTEISYKYKGAGHNLKAVMKGDAGGALTGYNYHKKAVNASTGWSNASISVSALEQEPYWGEEADLNIDKVVALQWEVKGTASPNYLYVDDVKCDGMTIVQPTSSNSETSSSSAAACTEGQEIISGASHIKCIGGKWVDLSGNSSSSASTNPGIALIDDFQDENTQAESLGEAYWYIYESNGGSVTNKEDKKIGWDMVRTAGTNGYVAMEGISGITNGSTKYPSVGMGIDVPTSAFANCTAITYDYKGSAHKFRASLSTVTPDKGYEHVTEILPKASAWTPVTVKASDLSQPDWVDEDELKDFSWARVIKLAWVVDEKIENEDRGTELDIDNVQCVGTLPTPKSSSSTIANSSASTTYSSSSNGTDGDTDEGRDGKGNDREDDTSIGVVAASAGLNASIQGKTLVVSVARAGLVKVQVFDMMGHAIERHSENMVAGSFAHDFAKLNKGAYIVRVQQGSMVKTVRMQVR